VAAVVVMVGVGVAAVTVVGVASTVRAEGSLGERGYPLGGWVYICPLLAKLSSSVCLAVGAVASAVVAAAVAVVVMMMGVSALVGVSVVVAVAAAAVAVAVVVMVGVLVGAPWCALGALVGV
jgi:hypothetical protein